MLANLLAHNIICNSISLKSEDIPGFGTVRRLPCVHNIARRNLTVDLCFVNYRHNPKMQATNDSYEYCAYKMV